MLWDELFLHSIRDHLSSKWTFTAGASFILSLIFNFLCKKFSYLSSAENFPPFGLLSLHPFYSLDAGLLTVRRAFSIWVWGPLWLNWDISKWHLLWTSTFCNSIIDLCVVLHRGPISMHGDQRIMCGWDAHACIAAYLHAQISDRFRISIWYRTTKLCLNLLEATTKKYKIK